MKEKIYSTKEFAQTIGISKNHLLKLETDGKLPPAQRIAKGKVEHRYYTVENIIEYRRRLKMPSLVEKRKVQLFLNFKGGTGKSTISASYAYAIAELGVEVLAIDIDAQQHMTKCLGFEATLETPSIYDVFIEDRDINDVIAKTAIPTLDIIPANIKLSVIENRCPAKEMREFLLTSALNRIKCKDYKIIVIDSLPSITLLNKNAMLAADELLIPVLPDFFSFDGLGLLFEEIARMRQSYALYSDFRGRLLNNIYIFINQYRPNELMSKQNKAALEKYYSQYLCKTIIPYNTKLAQSTAAGVPVFQYDRNCAAAKQIRRLIEEILKLNEGPRKKHKNQDSGEEVT